MSTRDSLLRIRPNSTLLLCSPPRHTPGHTAISALHFFRRPPSTVGHSSVGHSTASHSTSSATTHSSILTNASTSTQLTEYSNSSCPSDSLSLPPLAHVHPRATSLPGSRPVSFAGTPSSSAIGGSSDLNRPISVARSQSSTLISPSAPRKSGVNPTPATHQRSRTSTNADNWNPLWAHTLSTVSSTPPIPKVLPSASPSKASPPMSSTAQSPFGPAEIPKFSRKTLSQSGVVMPISAKEWRRRQSIAVPSAGPDPSTGRIDKGKGKDRDVQCHIRQRVSFVDDVGGGAPRGPSPSQQPSQVPPVEVRVHPPSPISPAHTPEIAFLSPTQPPDTPEGPTTPDLPQEPHTLSPKSSAASFATCTSSASPPSSASPTRTTFALPPSPAPSSVLTSTDTSGDEPQVPPARPRPRKRLQSTPQSGAGSRLSFVDAVMRLSAASIGSFVTAHSGTSDSSSGVSADEKKTAREVGGGEGDRDVLPRARSLDGFRTSSLRFPPSPPPPMPVDRAGVTSRQGSGPNATVDPTAAADGAYDARTNDNPRICRERRSANEVNKDYRQSMPMSAHAQPREAPRPQEQQRKRKLTKTRPASVRSSSVPPMPASPAPPLPHAHESLLAPHNALKHAPTVLSPIIEDGSSHGHSSSHGHGHEQERVRVSPVKERSRPVEEDVFTVPRTGHIKEGAAAVDKAVSSTKASASPTKASMSSPVNASASPTKASTSPFKASTSPTKASTPSPTKANTSSVKASPSSAKSDGSRTHSKRYSFRLSSLFRKSKEPKSGEVRDRERAESPPIASGTCIKPGAGLDRDSPPKGGKMRRKREVEDAIVRVPHPPPVAEDADVTVPSGRDVNMSNSNLGMVGLPHGNSEVTLVASHTPYPPSSPSPSSFFALHSHPSVVESGSGPGSAASSIRIPHAIPTGMNDVKCAETNVKSGIEVIVHADDDTTVAKNVNLCLAHQRSHGHLFVEKGAVTTVVADAGKLRPKSAASSRPGTASSTLTTSSDAASFSTVPSIHFPNPWDAVPVGLVPPISHHICLMCGRCGPQMPPPLPPLRDSFPLPAPLPVPVRSLSAGGPIQRPTGAASPIPPSPLQTVHTRAQTWAPAHSNGVVLPPPPLPYFQSSASPSPVPTPGSSPRKLKRPQTAPGVPRSKKSVDGKGAMMNMKASASVVHLAPLPKVEKESRVRGMLRGLFGITA